MSQLEGPELRLLEIAVLNIDSILVGYPHPYVKEKLETAKICIEAVLEEHGGVDATPKGETGHPGQEST